MRIIMWDVVQCSSSRGSNMPGIWCWWSTPRVPLSRLQTVIMAGQVRVPMEIEDEEQLRYQDVAPVVLGFNQSAVLRKWCLYLTCSLYPYTAVTRTLSNMCFKSCFTSHKYHTTVCCMNWAVSLFIWTMLQLLMNYKCEWICAQPVTFDLNLPPPRGWTMCLYWSFWSTVCSSACTSPMTTWPSCRSDRSTFTLSTALSLVTMKTHHMVQHSPHQCLLQQLDTSVGS